MAMTPSVLSRVGSSEAVRPAAGSASRSATLRAHASSTARTTVRSSVRVTSTDGISACSRGWSPVVAGSAWRRWASSKAAQP